MPRLLLLLPLLAAASAGAAPPLRWGADSQGGAPYVFQDPMDPTRLVGFEVELASLLAAKLGPFLETVAAASAWGVATLAGARADS